MKLIFFLGTLIRDSYNDRFGIECDAISGTPEASTGGRNVMTPQNRGSNGWFVLLGIIAISGMQERASASTLFGSEFFRQQIMRIDTATNSVTPIALTPGNPDSLLFFGQNIIYTDESSQFHALREINLTTHVDTILSNQFVVPTDLTLTPDGQSVLVGDFGEIIRKYDFQSQTPSVFANPGVGAFGLAFDPTGRLFANLGNLLGGGPTGHFSPNSTPRLVRSCKLRRA
jgi:hypothetical protein